MKLLFLSGSRSRAAGGVFEVECALAKNLYNRHGLQIEAAGYGDKNSSRDNQDWKPISVHCFDRIGPHQFGYSPQLARWLIGSKHDVLHLHNLWMYTSLAALRWHKSTNRPFIISPHGMLDPWALKNSGWKKRLAEFFYERRMLSKAAVIHGFHEKDLVDIRNYGLRNPVAVIPNGVNLPASDSRKTKRRNDILFLGRIHPKKGLTELIDGWSLLTTEQRASWTLSIVGWDDGGYLAGLKDQVARLGLHSSVRFLGPVFGEDKNQLFRTSASLVLPSFSEGLPMTVLEAWAHSQPVIMTEMCNLPRGFECNAALKIKPNPVDIAHGLAEFLSLSEDSRQKYGENGRRLVANEFTWDFIADQFLSVYQWMLVGGQIPDCLRFCD